MNEDALPTQASSLDADRSRDVFIHDEVVVDGVSLHYVAGGSGRPVLLLPGWPQSWYAWRFVMPRLAAQGRRVVALDLRGFGDSGKPGDYALATVAAEVRAFAKQLGLLDAGPLDVAAHDIGVWVGHALAALCPTDVRRLALLDAALPGLTPPPPAQIPSDEAVVRTWHFAFNRLPDLPELLVAGKERAFLQWMFLQKAKNVAVFDDSALDEYSRIFSAPGGAKAGFDYYRAAFSAEGLADSRARARRRLPMPVLTMGAEYGVGRMLGDTLEAIADDVRNVLIEGSGHYLPEEAPERVAMELGEFLR